MSGNFKLDDYVDVAARVGKFYEKHPDGSLQSEVIELGSARVTVKAYAYRSPDDPRPGIGHSWLNIPGSTPYTKGSELENAETSAVGRALAMLGFEVKKGMASREEVRNKQGGQPEPPRTVRGEVAAQTDGPWEGKVTTGRAPVDMNLREAADGATFGFVVSEEIPGAKFPRKTQVLVHGDLAHAVSTAFAGMPADTAMVWGSVEMVPWQKDGQDMRPFRRVHATRVMTPDWTLPATDAVAPVSVAPGAPSDLDGLDW